MNTGLAARVLEHRCSGGSRASFGVLQDERATTLPLAHRFALRVRIFYMIRLPIVIATVPCPSLAMERLIPLGEYAAASNETR